MARPKLRYVLLAFLIIAALAFVFGSLIGRTPKAAPLPNPNGYDDFIRAAGLMTVDLGDYRALEHDKLQSLISTNAEALRVLRVGLSRQCSIPTEFVANNF